MKANPLMSLRFFLLNLLTVTILLVLLELYFASCLRNAARIPGFLLPAFRTFYLYHERKVLQYSPCAAYDSLLFYSLRPGECRFFNREFDVAVHVNSKRFRDDEESLVLPEVVFAGDSFTVGWGVEQDETFPQIVERLTKSRALNAGMSSYGTAREMLSLGTLDLSGVRHLVIQYHSNDYEENVAFNSARGILSVKAREQYDSVVDVQRHREKYYPFKYVAGVSRGLGRHLLRPEPPTPSGDEQARAFMETLRLSLPLTFRGTIHVLHLDDHQDMTNDFLTALENDNSIAPAGVSALKCIRVQGLLTPGDYFILDDHLRPAGHQKIAQEVAASIHSN